MQTAESCFYDQQISRELRNNSYLGISMHFVRVGFHYEIPGYLQPKNNVTVLVEKVLVNIHSQKNTLHKRMTAN